jgi:alcohol dehydrogenase YqhD (iron-dependent ADH family)
MRDFTFNNPTRIEFGKGKENHIGRYVEESGAKSVLILYGSERIRQNGLFDRVTSSLEKHGISFEALGGVVSNPKLSLAREAIQLVKNKNLQAVVALGGGSVLDSAKTIAAGAKYDGDVWDFFTGKAVVATAVPVFAVMTLAATGSEMNGYGVVTHDETRQKFAIYSPLLYPRVSVINPELMATVTPDYLAYSAVDIFAHCLDLYFSADYMPEFGASLIENILLTVMRTTGILLKDPSDYDARGEFAWASTMALNGLTFAGAEGNSYDTHMVEHAMSALYNVPHGAGLSVVLPAWMTWYIDRRPDRFKRFAEKIFGVNDAAMGIDKLRGWFMEIGSPVTLAQAGIPEEGIDALRTTPTAWPLTGTCHNPIPGKPSRRS